MHKKKLYGATLYKIRVKTYWLMNDQNNKKISTWKVRAYQAEMNEQNSGEN